MSDEREEASLSGFESFVDTLYQEGDPQRKDQGENEVQSPLYDALRLDADRYEVQELIAKGGMKEVYLVYDRKAARQVALAKPLRKLGRDYYDSFLREAHLTARLEHPCIINLFGMGVDEDERPFFTMEFKRGRSLKRTLCELSEGQDLEEWPLLRRLGLLLKICEGLSYAHSRRVLHLDLKPGNIQVGSFGEVQICDWGLGVVMQAEKDGITDVLLDPDLYGSMQREVKGTSDYMAPELFNLRQAKIPQMDIFSLGCIMEELISPVGLKEEVDQALLAIVDKAKAENPKARYSSVEDMHRDAERYLGGYRTSVEKKTAQRELALFYRRNRQVSNIILASAFTLLAAGIYFVGNIHASRMEADEARIVAEKAMNTAVKAKTEEERERMRALEALADLQEEKKLSDLQMQREAQLAGLESHRIVELYFAKDIALADLLDSKLQAIEAVAVEDLPPHHYIWNQMFWMYFLTQKFGSALQLLEDGKTVSPDLIPLAREFAERQVGTGAAVLSDSDFEALLERLNSPNLVSRAGLGERMLEYDLRNPRTLSARASFVKRVLSTLNPTWKLELFEYNPDTQSLRLGGRGLTHLCHPNVNSEPSRCVLRFINPVQLDIRGTGLQSLREISQLELISLDIRETSISSVVALREMRSLRRVIVAPSQVTSELSESLPPFAELVVLP